MLDFSFNKFKKKKINIFATHGVQWDESLHTS